MAEPVQNQDPPKPPTIGLSMGNMNILPCIMTNREAKVYFEVDNYLLPAFVTFTDDGISIGIKSYLQWERNPRNTIYDCKRLIGRTFDDPDIQDYLSEWPFKVIDVNNIPKYEVTWKGQTHSFYPEEIMALLFKKAKMMVEYNINEVVNNVVIAVPSQFNPNQRQAVKDAAFIAGFEQIYLINECTAAVICHSYRRNLVADDNNIAVMSAGSGFLDISFIRFSCHVLETQCTSGTPNFDLTRTLVKHFASIVLAQHGINVYSDPVAYVRLWCACERARFEIRSSQKTKVIARNLVKQGVDFVCDLTRTDLDDLLWEHKSAMRDLLRDIALKYQWTTHYAHECILVGGSAHLPAMQDDFDELMRGVGHQTIAPYPELYAAIGAAMTAASQTVEEQNPFVDLIIMEIAPKTISMMSLEGKSRPLLERGITIPRWRTAEYSSEWNDQSSVRLQIFEGDHKLAAKNKLLGTYVISGFDLLKKGMVNARISFSIDKNGLMKISAVDRTYCDQNQVERELRVTKEGDHLTREQLQKIKSDFLSLFPAGDQQNETPQQPNTIQVMNQEGMEEFEECGYFVGNGASLLNETYAEAGVKDKEGHLDSNDNII